MKSSGIHRQPPAFLQKEPQEKQICTDISDHRGNSSTCSPHPQGKDKDRIQDHVHHSPQDTSHHGSSGKSLCPQKVQGCIGHNDKGSAQGNVGIVLGGIGYGIPIRP